MKRVRRRLACCTRDRLTSIDFDHPRLRSRPSHAESEAEIARCDRTPNSHPRHDDDCAAPSLAPSCSSIASPCHSPCLLRFSDADSIKDKFSRLLLGEDVAGGSRALSSALALSNAITNLAASIFGELWKLEPLPEEAKVRWRKEMGWFLSPTSYMIELVPAKQTGSNGHAFEIMTPRARADVHMNLPALQKLDAMLIEALDSMVKTEFWYAEGSDHKEGKEGCVRQSKRWWLPYPRVPIRGLSESARKCLISQGNVVHQVFKATKLINQNILSEMPVHSIIKDALPKAGRASLGEDLYNVLAEGSSSASKMADSLKLMSDYEALSAINKLEAAHLLWKERLEENEINVNPRVRKPWPFAKDTVSEADKVGLLVFKAELLLQELRLRYPYLPQSFLDATKIQYGKDIGHAIMEAYSRVLANLAHRILLRIGDILQENHTSNPTSPVPKANVRGLLSPNWILSPAGDKQRVRRSPDDRMSSRADSYFSDSNASRRSSDLEVSSTDARTSSAMTTPSSSRIWCIGGGDAWGQGSPYKTP